MATNSEEAQVRTELDGHGVLTVTLDRPDRLNAFTLQMLGELLDAFDRADDDPAVRAVVVTGSGRAFCSGADLAARSDTFNYKKLGFGETGPDGSERTLRDGGGLLTLRIFRCTKPVIAAINGAAVGVGATMLLPMDIRIAADSARFGFVFGARGIVPEAASSWFLPRIVGISQALEWCYTSRVFPAAEALEGGLVRSLHPADEVLGVAQTLARDIAATSAPVSVALTRMMMWRMLGASHPMEAHRVDSRAVNETGRGADAREGITAFFEKREPSWSMEVPGDLPSFVPWWDEPEFE